MTHRNNGFTLVEMMISMSFLSMLLLGIALLVLQISSIYNKGLTLKAVNETGQQVTSDIQRTINTSEPLAVKFVQDTTVNPTGGRLCAGPIVYAWNYGRTIESGSGNLNFYPTTSRDIRLVKFKAANTTPTGGAVKYCETTDGSYPALPPQATVNALIEGGTNNLAIHSFKVLRDAAEPDPSVYGLPVEGDPSQRIYRITMVIGTNEPKIYNEPSGIPANGCVIPDSVTDDEYCAVNEFDFTARAGNRDRSQSL